MELIQELNKRYTNFFYLHGLLMAIGILLFFLVSENSFLSTWYQVGGAFSFFWGLIIAFCGYRNRHMGEGTEAFSKLLRKINFSIFSWWAFIGVAAALKISLYWVGYADKREIFSDLLFSIVFLTVLGLFYLDRNKLLASKGQGLNGPRGPLYNPTLRRKKILWLLGNITLGFAFFLFILSVLLWIWTGQTLWSMGLLVAGILGIATWKYGPLGSKYREIF